MNKDGLISYKEFEKVRGCFLFWATVMSVYFFVSFSQAMKAQQRYTEYVHVVK